MNNTGDEDVLDDTIWKEIEGDVIVNHLLKTRVSEVSASESEHTRVLFLLHFLLVFFIVIYNTTKITKLDIT